MRSKFKWPLISQRKLFWSKVTDKKQRLILHVILYILSGLILEMIHLKNRTENMAYKVKYQEQIED